MEQSFQPGDAVYHISNSKLIMAVEAIHEKEIYCSWLDPKTSEKKDGNFSIVSLRKVDNGYSMEKVGIFL